MLTSNEDPTIAENTGILYVVPQSTAERQCRRPR
jgi:hypothetical protein